MDECHFGSALTIGVALLMRRHVNRARDGYIRFAVKFRDGSPAIAVFVTGVTARRRLSMSPHTPAGGMSSAEPRWRAE